MVHKLFQEIFEVVIWLQSIGSGGLSYAVENGAGSGSVFRGDHMPAVSSDAEFAYAAFSDLCECSDKSLYAKESLIRIFTLKSLQALNFR